jgi:hypothetical protein
MDACACTASPFPYTKPPGRGCARPAEQTKASQPAALYGRQPIRPSQDAAQHRKLIGASRACSGYPARALHSVLLKCLAACPAKSFTVLLEALLDGVIAFRQLISAKPRRIARASLAFLRRALSGLGSRIAASQNQRGNGYQNNSAHCFLQGNRSIPLDGLRWNRSSGGCAVSPHASTRSDDPLFP